MFEKSLYDLIRGLRHQKASEKEYIQASLRECRKEIKGQDMTLKATALLKLTYLEMLGYDMSWASFHVLEVMSSLNFSEKRVGYLAAIQSFRSDTEVVMLAENLLKKDLTSAHRVTISLALVAIPHVINPSMANSLLTDLLPRLTHTLPNIRKKTIVTLYRLALVYPDTLRPAWPKIKERLLDEGEDPSVTAAIVNVVCELGWRRPQDFLPLAPRLFELLVDGRNNWMAIKIIKLFATLTPLEPRLIKKILPPMTNILKTTPAMSLLYECVNGIVEGGILASVEGTTEGDELARLCVGKLRSMLVIEGDPNLKFVALLTFEKIVISHPYLVSLHQDVLLGCIDDGDISIRQRALNLVTGMVNPDNLPTVVNKLLDQLLSSPTSTAAAAQEASALDEDPYNSEAEDEDGEEALRSHEAERDDTPPLPDDYRISVIQSILEMCSKGTYSNLNDFEWYIEVLVKLVKACPMIKSENSSEKQQVIPSNDISYKIGNELRNVAVRVKAMRSEATIAAQSLVLLDNRDRLFPSFSNGGQGVLDACVWLVGEYASKLSDSRAVLSSILHSSTAQLPPTLLCVYLQAMLKVFSRIVNLNDEQWTPQRRTESTLLMSRIIYFLEPLTTHSDLEVQEVSVEYLELIRLAMEAASSQPVSQDGEYVDPPLLLTQAIPSLFSGFELNPVAPGAQYKVEIPGDLDLNTPLNEDLDQILQDADNDALEIEHDDFEDLYYQAEESVYVPEAASDRLELAAKSDTYSSYQYTDDKENASAVARLKAERKERNKDDPFYIPDEGGPHASQLDRIIQNENGEALDIDSIPIMELHLEEHSVTQAAVARARAEDTDRRKKAAQRKKIQIVADETLGGDEPGGSGHSSVRATTPIPGAASKAKKSYLGFDSSGLGSLSLDGDARRTLDIEQREEEERALREVERLRLEMQRASERIQARETAVVKKKKKKPKTTTDVAATESPAQEDGTPVEGEGVVKRKKKKKKPVADESIIDEAAAEPATTAPTEAKPKKKKRRAVDLTAPGEEAG